MNRPELNFLLAAALCWPGLSLSGDFIKVGDFSAQQAGNGLPAGWKLSPLADKKPTRFILVESEGQVVVLAKADQVVAASMAVLTFISAAFCGEFLSRAFAAGGCYALGVL
ncbi:MAG: hypothetical protein ACREU0_00680, partial [Burkholderiales bacterium]